MSENQAVVRYNYRLRPGALAVARLELEWDCARWVWNQCVEASTAAYEARKEGVKHESPTWCRIARMLTVWRSKFGWLRKGSRVVQTQTVRKWAQSQQQAIKRPTLGFPKFKSSKRSLPSLEYTEGRFRIKKGQVFLVGGISIPVVWSRDLPSDPKSCVISRDSEGHWNVSFVTRRESEEFPPSDKAIGIDWGVSQVATTTTPAFNLPCGGLIKATARTLKKAQQKLSRAKRSSKGYFRAKLQVSRIHVKVARQRKDRAFKWARKVVTAFGMIAVEDFSPKFLAKSTMAKKAADGAVGMTKQILLTMAKAAKRKCVLVAPAFTTMDCSECGTRATARLDLSNRTFSCNACGYTAGRDENAARTICARAGFDPTNVDDISPTHDTGCVLAV